MPRPWNSVTSVPKWSFRPPWPSSPTSASPCTSGSTDDPEIWRHPHRPACQTKGRAVVQPRRRRTEHPEEHHAHHRERWRHGGRPGFSRRLFTALSLAGVNVVLVSQGSSEHAITIAVADGDARDAEAALNQEFGADQHLGRIGPLVIESGFAIVAVVETACASRAASPGAPSAPLAETA